MQRQESGRLRGALTLTTLLVTALVIMFAASPSWGQATPSLMLNPDSGAPGSALTATGSSWPPSTRTSTCTVHLRWGGPTGPTLGQATVTATGTWNMAIAVPASTSVGTHLVHAAGEGAACRATEGRATFTVIAATTTTTTSTTTTTTTPPSITTTTTIVSPSTTTTTTITLPPPPTQGPGSPTTTSLPDQTTSTVPDATPATTTTTTITTITTIDTSHDADPGDDSGLVLDRPAGPPGGSVDATGHGCDPGAAVHIDVAGVPAGATEADPQGRFRSPLALAQLEPGRYEVTARCGPALVTSIDIVLISSNQGASSSLAVLVFFVLIGLGTVHLQRTVTPTRRS